MPDLIKMLEKSKPVRVPGTAVFLTNDPTSAPSSLMHNLKHNKVLHERVVLLNVRTETTPRVTTPTASKTSLSPDFMLVTLHFGYMEQPHIPRALAAMRKAGLKFDIMTTSFFLGRRTLKTAPNSGMPLWQDKLFIAMTKQAASAPDFFNLPVRPGCRARRADEGLSATPQATSQALDSERDEAGSAGHPRMKVYLINLDRHPDRLAHMRGQLHGIAFERIAAFDGSSKPPTAKGLTRFELACLESHQVAWRQFLGWPGRPTPASSRTTCTSGRISMRWSGAKPGSRRTRIPSSSTLIFRR